MCWRTNHIDIIKKGCLVAEEDIPCYKILKDRHDDLESIYYSFQYKFNTEYENDVNFDDEYSAAKLADKINNHWGYMVEVNEGFHSYSYELTETKRIGINQIKIFRKDNKNLLDWYENKFNLLVKVNCIIPKGSKYLLNEKGEYVSNKIKIIDVCVGWEN